METGRKRPACGAGSSTGRPNRACRLFGRVETPGTGPSELSTQQAWRPAPQRAAAYEKCGLEYELRSLFEQRNGDLNLTALGNLHRRPRGAHGFAPVGLVGNLAPRGDAIFSRREIGAGERTVLV